MARRKPRMADLRRKSPNQDRAKRTVENIIAAAHKVLSSENIRSPTVRQIAMATGISVGLLYDYFPSKQALFYRVYKDRLDALLLMFDEAFSEETPARSFEAAFNRYLQLQRAAQYPTRVDLELQNAIDRDPQLAKMTKHFEDSLSDRYVNVLRRYGSNWSEADLRKLAFYAHQIDHVNLKLQGLEPRGHRKIYGDLTTQFFFFLAQHCGATTGVKSSNK